MTKDDNLDTFRREVCSFLDRAFSHDLRVAMTRQAGMYAEPEIAERWHRALYEQGWITPAWPVEHGGTGWSHAQRALFQEECAKAGVPVIPGIGLNLCGPVIIRFGTEDQKRHFLPRMRSGEHHWCQGYSEPGAGSDLSALSTRAERDGDDYVVNGSKIWTTDAHIANWIFLLVRTSSTGKRQQGITFLVSPMDAPGITVRPILSLSGHHELNQVFFDNVRIPVANRIGEEGQGWTIAKYLLEFERGGPCYAPGLMMALATVRAIAAREPDGHGGVIFDDPDVERSIALLEIGAMAVDWTERRIAEKSAVGQSVGQGAASLKKLQGTELSQRIAELKAELLGRYAAVDQSPYLGIGDKEPPIGPDHAALPMAQYLNGRATTIYAGASEIQRNILFRTVLAERVI